MPTDTPFFPADLRRLARRASQAHRRAGACRFGRQAPSGLRPVAGRSRRTARAISCVDGHDLQGLGLRRCLQRRRRRVPDDRACRRPVSTRSSTSTARRPCAGRDGCSRSCRDEQRVFGITGWKNSGKTTLTEKLVAEFTRRGFRVSTVKHAHHDFDIDREGADSHRHRMAGAAEVAIVSGKRWALMHELRGEDEPKLEQILARLAPCDLVLVEGYKREGHRKIETRRLDAKDTAPLSASDPNIRAVACRPRRAGRDAAGVLRSTMSRRSPTSSQPKPAWPRSELKRLCRLAKRRMPLRNHVLTVLRLIFAKKQWEYRASGRLGNAGRWPRARLAIRDPRGNHEQRGTSCVI